MYTEKKDFRVITLDKDIILAGKNLQNSGLPITFDSLGKMWDIYSHEDINNTPCCVNKDISYGVCENKIPDYVVCVEVSENKENREGFKCITIPAGQYVKVEFNGENHDDLVCNKLMTRQTEAKKWAKENKIKLNGKFTIEVYPKDTVEQEYPEMHCLFPIL